jgi:glucose-1-phosphate cytidylyltransferase
MDDERQHGKGKEQTVKAVILAGGMGTRISEESYLQPKPMIEIGGKPILWHIMKIYARHDITEFVLLLGYKGDIIREFFVNYIARTTNVTVDLSRADPGRLTFHGAPSEPWKVTLVDTGEDAMTGARLWRARHYLQDADCFCATYGDGVADVDITATLNFHWAHGRIGTLTGVFPPSRFGELNVEGGTVLTFNEKPQVPGGYINGGFFVFQREFIDRYLDDREDLILEREPIERLAADRQLMMFPHKGFWQPMDTPREYGLLNELWASGKAPWKSW